MPARRVILAEYFMTPPVTFLFVAREDFDEPEVTSIPLSLEQITDFIGRNFREERDVAGKATVSTHEKLQALDESGFQDFFSPLVQPLAAMSRRNDLISEEGDIIWFVPHDVLHYLPLHALKVDGRLLLERNPVCYTPSAAVMKYCQSKRTGRRKSALVFADSRNDLVHARDEALVISHLFQTTPFLGEQASKAILLEQLNKNNFDVLHFSCHGFFNEDEPLQSGILLAETDTGDETDDQSDSATLTAEEIFDLQLHADLITLSACESGVSEREPGDELIGLTRALIFAGTPSVVVSLWSVDDLSTSLLIERFYEELLGSESTLNKAEALRAAQLYIKDLPAKQVVERAEAHLAELQPEQNDLRWSLWRNKAYAQTIAGDLPAAIEIYSQLLMQMKEAGVSQGELLSLEQRLELLRFKDAESPVTEVNYEVQPFSHFYYWAPFVLVGDWK